MQREWPTQQYDIADAKAILASYEHIQQEPIDFQEEIISLSDHIELHPAPPSWMFELLHHYIQRYGHEHGCAVMSMVMTQLLLDNQPRH